MVEFVTPIYPQEPVRQLRPHILNLLMPLLWSILMLVPAMLITITLRAIIDTASPAVATAEWLFGGLYLTFVTSYFMMHVIFWYLDAWLIMPTGLIDIQLISLFNRRIAELNWSQVQDVRVAISGVLANLFGFGDVIVQSAGRQGMFEMHSIPRANDVSKLIIELSDAGRREEAGSARGISPTQHLGEILVQQSSLTPNELTLSLQEQKKTGKRIGQILIEHNFISREELVKVLAYQYHVPHIDLSRYDIESDVIRLMPYETAVKYHAIPIDRSPDDVLSIAVAQPSNEVVTDLMSQFDMPLTFLVADEHYIQEAITGHYLNADRVAGPTSPPPFSSPESSDPSDISGE